MPIVIDEMSPPKEKDFFDEIEEAINTKDPIELALRDPHENDLLFHAGGT